MSIRAGRDLLHDAVSMTRAISEGQQNMQDLGLQRQQVIDASWSVRHAGGVYIIQYTDGIITTCRTFAPQLCLPPDFRSRRLCWSDA